MPEIKLTQGETVATTETIPETNWRRRLLAAGFMLLFLDVILAALAKDKLGNAPMVLAAVAIALVAISAIGSLIHYVSSKAKHA